AAQRGAERVLAGLRPEVGIEDVACMLGVTTRTVRRMELRGELPTRLGRTWLRSDIERWRAERRDG
ncbi:helix-turn-helix domain-containing protein, partial [Ottowia sp.]|uniref:helix-turn-helix domain-containing protein n=1 Tax=Ottowia sp. TaxID=1898956 RepID=UPI0039E2EDB2